MNDLEEALDKLRHQESFQLIVAEIQATHADKVRDLTDCDEDKIQRLIGEVSAYQQLLDLLKGI